jgi:hypothetical protein
MPVFLAILLIGRLSTIPRNNSFHCPTESLELLVMAPVDKLKDLPQSLHINLCLPLTFPCFFVFILPQCTHGCLVFDDISSFIFSGFGCLALIIEANSVSCSGVRVSMLSNNCSYKSAMVKPPNTWSETFELKTVEVSKKSLFLQRHCLLLTRICSHL